jgi:predicted SAM-dependent methyltransferase
LKAGGYVRAAVPDGMHPDPEYRDAVRPGGTGLGADDHKVLYDHESFRRIFEKVGFSVNLLEYFDKQGEFHFKAWNPHDGMILRSRRHDKRNKAGGLGFTSIILDAIKQG